MWQFRFCDHRNIRDLLMENLEVQWGNEISIPLERALKLKVNEGKFYIYKLTVGGKFYVGFTSQDPEERVKQHVDAAKNGSSNLVHAALRRYAFLHELEILSEHSNEILALVDEIATIEKLSPQLNISIGGEGKIFTVREDENRSDGNVLVVEHNSNTKRLRKREVKKDAKYLRNLLWKIEQRYTNLENRYPVFRIKYRNQTAPKLWLDTIERVTSSSSINRGEVGLYFLSKRSLYRELDKFDELAYSKHEFISEWSLRFLSPSKKPIYHKLGGTSYEAFIDENRTIFNSNIFPSAKRMVLFDDRNVAEDTGHYYRKTPPEIETNFSTRKEAQTKLRKSNWFKAAIKLNLFEPGDLIYPVFIDIGTYQTGFLGLKTETNTKTEGILYDDLIEKIEPYNTDSGKSASEKVMKEKRVEANKADISFEQKQSFATRHPNLTAEAEDLNQSLDHKNDTRTKAERPGIVRDFYIALTVTIGLFLFLGFTGILDIIDQWINS
jgi:hypothetical protein